MTLAEARDWILERKDTHYLWAALRRDGKAGYEISALKKSNMEYKAKQAFFSVTNDRVIEKGEVINEEAFVKLPNGDKEYFEQDEVTVVVDQQILDLNPELKDEGVQVGDTVTFGGFATEEEIAAAQNTPDVSPEAPETDSTEQV